MQEDQTGDYVDAGYPPFIFARTSRGFSLIEAVISLLIVSMGSMATLSMLTQSRVNNTIEQERARAHQIVSDQLERVRVQLYSMITGGSQVTIWDNGTPNDAADDTKGTLEIRITDPETGAVLVKAPTPAKRVQLEVTLSWNPRGSISKKTLRETVMTYLAP